MARKKNIIRTPEGLDIYQAMKYWSEEDVDAFMARMGVEGVRNSWSPTMAYARWGAPVGWSDEEHEKYTRLATENKERNREEE